MKAKAKVLFWGSGKMACGVALGLGPNAELYFYSPSGKSAENLAHKLGGRVFHKEADNNFDIIVLAHKPQQLNEAASELKSSVEILPGTIVISLLAGTRLSKIATLFKSQKVIRLMPNTPIAVGEGLLGWFFGPHTDLQKEILSFFKEAGTSLVIENEDKFDAYAAIAGSGPAYLFELARIMEKEYLDLGLPAGQSRETVAKLFFGSSKLMSESIESFEDLRNAVTSKGGVTAEALKVLGARGLPDIVKEALEQNIARSKELQRME